ncbi:probable Vacuolar protein sorting/targeting protein 10 [Zygosaccharomyces bailii]|nr:probable Vacuolar protein sorting/targeting protein 10 [Zygosaccharomyces bailii]
MLIRLLLSLWACLAAIGNAADFKPKVTRSSKPVIYSVKAFDDSTTLLMVQKKGLFVSFDNGGKWEAPEGVPAEVIMVDVDEYHRHDRAFAVTNDFQYYITEDQGKHWRHIQPPKGSNDFTFCELDSHPLNRDYFLLRCSDCSTVSLPGFGEFSKRAMFIPSCKEESYVSSNGGKSFRKLESPQHPSQSGSQYLGVICKFGVNSADSKLKSGANFIYCLEGQMDEWFQTNGVLFYTSDFGKTTKMVDQFKDVTVSDFQVLDSHILAYTLEDRFNRLSAAQLWVSSDGFNFKKAYLPTLLRYTSLYDATEDSLGRIVLPLSTMMEESNSASQILLSDSSGLKFSILQVTPEDILGFSTIATSPNLRGTMWADFMSITNRPFRHAEKDKPNHLSKVTFDSGATWSNLKVVDPTNRHKKLFHCDINDVEHCSLHKFFGDPVPIGSAGILMTLGTIGDGTESMWEDIMTFISRDGGATWEVAFEYPCAYAFGDLGNIILAMPIYPDEDNDPQGEFYYSLDQGKSWEEYQLEVPITPMDLLSTTPDGSGLNFIISSFNLDNSPNNGDADSFFYTIDFSEAFEGKICGNNDFEPWYLANGDCVNGAKYSYRRRKQDSRCLVRKLFEDLTLKEEICEQCTEKDYECSFEFSRDSDGQCKPDYKLLGASSICDNSEGEIELKPMQKVTNSKCRKELKVESTKVSCAAKSDILITENVFHSKIRSYQYFDTNEDESLIIDTVKDGVYISHDSGQNIKKFEPGEDITEIVFNSFHSSHAYLFGKNGNLYVTRNRGKSFETYKLPYSRQLGMPLDFHAKDANTFIYYGGKDCENIFNPACHAVAYFTRDGGKNFVELLDNAIHCEFAGSLFKHPVDESLIYCQVKEPQSRKRTLMSSVDFFQTDKKTVLDTIIGYMNTGEFIVMAVPLGNSELRAYVTVDGAELAEAKFPPDMSAEKQEAFTVLGSETGSIFFHLTTNDEPGGEFGELLKSNSNGTSFVRLESAVNRNSLGMVDFERIQALEGIIIINVVDNPERVLAKEEDKLLKSKITFNDGSDWSYIQAPLQDSERKPYACNPKQLEKCSLHLHGYTERNDLRDTLSSSSAFGMLFGIGNVGEYLLPEDQCSTFFSKDGGETWTEIKKGAYQWEFGDHGGVLVLVPKNEATNTLTYSLGMGDTWSGGSTFSDYVFTDEKILVQDIVTVPRDSALRFLLVGSSTSVQGISTKTFTIDFTQKFKRQCIINGEKPDGADFSYFSLGESDSKCLFGHQARYLMKTHSECFVGNAPLSEFYEITQNCSCTRNDFECDYNFYKAYDGTCKLVEGLSPADSSEICKKEPDLIEYFKPTGYRKIPLSTCVGGLRLDDTSAPLPCPGKEKQFKEKYKVNRTPYFLSFLFFFLLLLAITWFIYDRGIRRNGGFARFGEIRLDGDDLIENNGTDKLVNSIVRSGFYAASAVFSGYQLLKRSLGNTALRISERFSRRRGPTYSSLLHDQFMDEADDLLTGHDEDANTLGSILGNDENFEIDDDDVVFPADHTTLSEDISASSPVSPAADAADPARNSPPATAPEQAPTLTEGSANDINHENTDNEQDLGVQ